MRTLLVVAFVMCVVLVLAVVELSSPPHPFDLADSPRVPFTTTMMQVVPPSVFEGFDIAPGACDIQANNKTSSVAKAVESCVTMCETTTCCRAVVWDRTTCFLKSCASPLVAKVQNTAVVVRRMPRDERGVTVLAGNIPAVYGYPPGANVEVFWTGGGRAATVDGVPRMLFQSGMPFDLWTAETLSRPFRWVPPLGSIQGTPRLILTGGYSHVCKHIPNRKRCHASNIVLMLSGTNVARHINSWVEASAPFLATLGRRAHVADDFKVTFSHLEFVNVSGSFGFHMTFSLDGVVGWTGVIRFTLVDPEPAAKKNDDNRVIPKVLVSTAAHECVECFQDWQRNVAFYLPECTSIVVHTPADPTNEIHRYMQSAQNGVTLFLNPHHETFPDAHLNLLFFHMSNIRFLLKNKTVAEDAFTHVLFMSSNELFVRRGVGNYLRHFDAVVMDFLDPASPPMPPFLYEHFVDSFRGGAYNNVVFCESYAECISRDVVMWPKLWDIRPYETDWALMNATSAIPSSYVFFEGTFLPPRLAVLMAEWVSSPPRCPNYPTSEVYPAAYLRNAVRPLERGHRVSTTVWRNALWTVTKDDVDVVRCLPKDVPPFALKRVAREMNDAVRVYIRNRMEKGSRDDEGC